VDKFPCLGLLTMPRLGMAVPKSATTQVSPESHPCCPSSVKPSDSSGQGMGDGTGYSHATVVETSV
jgi:hypothetical protein